MSCSCSTTASTWLSAVADLVEGLTARLPRLRVLATSREPLWVVDELCYRLAPLPVVGTDASRDGDRRESGGAPVPGASRCEDAGCARHGSCRPSRRRDLPSRRRPPARDRARGGTIAGIDLEDLSAHLDDLFDLLPQPARRADGVQRSLRTTVEWSDALLGEEERRLLRRMSVFAGEFDLPAIAAVCASDGQTAASVADLTARLVEKSLLLKQDDRGQYQLLETIRQYAVEQLDRGR